jgi:hypothetical protein
MHEIVVYLPIKASPSCLLFPIKALVVEVPEREVLTLRKRRSDHFEKPPGGGLESCLEAE